MKLSKIDFGGWTAGTTKSRLEARDSEDAKNFREALRQGVEAMQEAEAYYAAHIDEMDFENTLKRLKDAVANNKLSVEKGLPQIQKFESCGAAISSQCKHIYGVKAHTAWTHGEVALKAALRCIPVERDEDVASEQALFSAAGVAAVPTQLVARWDNLRGEVTQRLEHLQSAAGDLMRRHVTPHPAQSIFQLFE